MVQYRNRIICGNCLDIMRRMDNESVDLIVTSPPYNCRIEYDNYDDALTWDDYYEFIREALYHMYRALVPGGTVALIVPMMIRWQREHPYANTWASYDPEYKTHKGSEKVFGKGRVEPIGMRLFRMMLAIDIHVREPIVWVKAPENTAIATTYQMGYDSDPFMRPCHEHILLGSKRQWFHRGGTGRRGKDYVPFSDYTKDVWFIPSSGDSEHPATFPQEIPDRLIKLFIHAKDALVLDPFCGVGTTCIAAAQAGYDYVGIDQSPKYCILATDRIKESIAEKQYNDSQLVFDL